MASLRSMSFYQLECSSPLKLSWLLCNPSRPPSNLLWHPSNLLWSIGVVLEAVMRSPNLSPISICSAIACADFNKLYGYSKSSGKGVCLSPKECV